MFIRAIHSRAGVSEFAGDFRVDKQTLVAVGALGEELALLLGVHILAYGVWLVALGPVFAPHLYLLCVSFLLLAFLNGSHSLHCRLDWAESFQSLPFQLLRLLLGKLLLKEWLAHRVMRALRLNIAVVAAISVAHLLAKHLVLMDAIAAKVWTAIVLSGMPAILLSFLVEPYLMSWLGHHVIGTLGLGIVVHMRGATAGSIALVAKLLPVLVSLVLSSWAHSHSAS